MHYEVRDFTSTNAEGFLYLKKALEVRKKFAADMLKKEDFYFDKILLSDKRKIELFGNNYYNDVWRESGSAYNMNSTLPTAKHGGDSIIS